MVRHLMRSYVAAFALAAAFAGPAAAGGLLGGCYGCECPCEPAPAVVSYHAEPFFPGPVVWTGPINPRYVVNQGPVFVEAGAVPYPPLVTMTYPGAFPFPVVLPHSRSHYRHHRHSHRHAMRHHHGVAVPVTAKRSRARAVRRYGYDQRHESRARTLGVQPAVRRASPVLDGAIPTPPARHR